MKKLILFFLLLISNIVWGYQIKKDSNEYEQYVRNIVRSNFTRINNIKRWQKTEKVTKDGLSSEGGEVTYFYSEKGLEKILIELMGESGKSVTEFYFLNKALSFIYEVDYTYNMPIYMDGFDQKKTKKIERRYYFKENEYFRYLTSETKSPSDSEKEQKGQEIIDFYKKIIN